MVYVGKASANHTMRQPDINKLLVKLAADRQIPIFGICRGHQIINMAAAAAKKPSSCAKQACRLNSFPA